ncbi:hypothetical protein WR25_04493 [Diploscapter pachys]|uniref:Secreted protein n=1 Tax=Diploscapter pachys TaxID=2018661 RepID=A0A2A2LFY3_9BILA|nr:hypothetical protein WR25_04493 [Diploscapter pachys]
MRFYILLSALIGLNLAQDDGDFDPNVICVEGVCTAAPANQVVYNSVQYYAQTNSFKNKGDPDSVRPDLMNSIISTYPTVKILDIMSKNPEFLIGTDTSLQELKCTMFCSADMWTYRYRTCRGANSFDQFPGYPCYNRCYDNCMSTNGLCMVLDDDYWPTQPDLFVCCLNVTAPTTGTSEYEQDGCNDIYEGRVLPPSPPHDC